MKKVNAIYTLPRWYYDELKEIKIKEGTYGRDIIDLSEIDMELRRPLTEKIENWIIENFWGGDISDAGFLGERMAFLWKVRAESYSTYEPMSRELHLIYEINNEEAARIAHKLYCGGE